MRSLKVFALLVALNMSAWMIPSAASAQQASVTYQLFYDQLNPYGMWVSYPNYGYVWIPNVDPGFSPYETAGHWVFTDDGWTWVSDYPWGWATFHYGRWDYDTVYGWFWVPDDEWGPAWVSWRSSPGYYGWAPLRPGISVSMAFGSGYHEQNDRWIFVRDGDIARSDIGSHYISRTNNATIISSSTVIVNTQKDAARNATYIAGPNKADVQKVTHTPVASVAIRETNQPGSHISNGELQLYRPQVQKGNGNGRAAAPSKVVKLSDVKPASERNAGNQPAQPRIVTPPSKTQPLQAQVVLPSDSKAREQQPRTASPPNKGQPQQPRAIDPSVGKGRVQQPRTASLPNKSQPQQPRVTNPSANKGKVKQPQNVTAPNKGQASPPRAVSPSNSKGTEKQPQNMNPPDRAQIPQRLDVSKSTSARTENQPLRITPPKKEVESQPVQPKPTQDEKEKKLE